MKRVWAFYTVMPALLLSVWLAFGGPTYTVAAPGQVAAAPPVRFVSVVTELDPNTTLELVNATRVSQGLQPLIADAGLAKLAQTRADDMVANNYYSHKNSSGKYYFDYFEDYNIVTGYNCENLNLVFAPNQQQIVHEWMSSLKGHRGCLVNPSVTKAGYASAKISLVDINGQLNEAYLVVAIHAAIK